VSEGTVGFFGDVSFGSLQRKKTLSVGEGGLIVTSDSAIYKRLQDITSPGSFHSTSKYSEIDFSGFGLNLRMSPFSAVVGKFLFPRIDEIVAQRSRTVDELCKILSEFNHFDLPVKPAYVKDISWYSLKVKVPPESVARLLSAKGGFWKFSELGYPPVIDHVFWRKNKEYFPFSMETQPLVRTELKGVQAYLENRISVAIPTISGHEWTDQLREHAVLELKNILGAK
jgi:dTDP-4-amino-4,6-dideoxygalactose transaminase